MSKKGRTCREAERALEQAIQKPIAWCHLSAKRRENLENKLADLVVGEHLILSPPGWPRIDFTVKNVWAIDLFLDCVRRGRLVAYKNEIKFDERILELYEKWKKTLEVYRQSRQRGTGLQQTQGILARYNQQHEESKAILQGSQGSYFDQLGDLVEEHPIVSPKRR